ncbi:MAG: 50S ribosomal protein L10 [bacterium]
MQKALKIKSVKDIKEKFDKSKVVILTDFKGLTMSQMSKLRKKLRPIDAEFKVFKNTLISRAIKDKSYDGMDLLLTGSTAVLFGYEDQIAPTKVLSAFIKENEKPVLKGGLLDGKVIDNKTIIMLSKLPSREVLLGMVVGTMKAPITNFVLDCKGILSKFVYALSAVRDKKKN